MGSHTVLLVTWLLLEGDAIMCCKQMQHEILEGFVLFYMANGFVLF